MTRDAFRFVSRVFRIPMWQLVLGAAAVVALGMALMAVVTGIFLVLFPLALVAFGVSRLFGTRAAVPPAEMWRRSDPRIIEVEYEVIEDRGRDPNRS